MMNESLYKENIAKEREIRKLSKDVQQYEQTILSLRNEISISKYHTPDVSKKDAEVMAGMCCTGAECGDWEAPVKDFSAVLREEMLSYQERIQKMENSLKSSGSDVRALRSANVSLREELHALRGVCAALAQQCQAHALRDQFKDDIIREMRRQLKLAKAQCKEVTDVLSRSGSVKSRDSEPREECVRDQPRRSRDDTALTLSDDCRSPRLVLSRDDLLAVISTKLSNVPRRHHSYLENKTHLGIDEQSDLATSVHLKSSTPDASRRAALSDTGQSPDVSVILLEHSTSAPVLLSDDSIARIEEDLLKQSGHCQASSKHRLDETFLKHCEQCPHRAPADTSTSFKKCVKIQAPEELEELFRNDRKGAFNDGNVNVKSEQKLEALNDPESIGRSSEVDSPSSSCASARAQYYHNKLLATLQILQNKEETVRVQTESLAVAETRIASLTARSNELKREIERKGRELKTIRETIQKSKIEKSDVSITAQIQEIDNQKNIVTTLQNNLGVIEDLYRECFYETAKQEGLIEMLRKSYLDVRLMDKEKSEQISRLHNVINTQKWSLDKCQDIASDVDNLKVEISNFLNSSNNDSGVWEESLAGDLTEDLQDIAGQLLRLRELLTGDCTCGLEEENSRLRQNNKSMENKLDDLRRKVADLENILENKDTVDRQHLENIRAKESELHSIRQQLAAVECDTRERGLSCDSYKMELQQTQVLFRDQAAELARVQALCQQHEETIRQLREELEHSKDISKEYCALRGSTCTAQRRVRALRAELARAVEHCAHLDACHRSEVKSLETALWEAQARGAALCEEARRATSSVRAWTRHKKNIQREQEMQIKQKESQIRLLELRLELGQNDTTLTRESENDTCTKCISARSMHSFERNMRKSNSSERNKDNPEPSCSKCPQIEGSCTSVGSRVRMRRPSTFETSASEMGGSTPVPPQRPARMKRFFCEKLFSNTQDASVKRPVRHDASTCNTGSVGSVGSVSGTASDVCRVSPDCRRCHVGHAHINTMPREVFGGSVEEVLTRVESAGAALADSQRRWNRHGTLHRT